MDTLRQELRLAVRLLARQPLFTLTALLTLALGLGANIAIFSIVNALLLRPLPLGPRSERVVSLHSTHRTQPEDWADARVSFPDLADLRTARSLEDVGGFLPRNVTLTSHDAAERVRAGSVTPNLFTMLGVSPVIGRQFIPADAALPGLESSVILTDGLWRRRYGADPSIVGRPILVNGRGRTVVGILPPRFNFPEREELYLPLRIDDPHREARSIAAFGLLRDGRSIGDLQHDLDAIAARLADEHPTSNRGWGLHALPFRDLVVSRNAAALSSVLLGAVAFVLLIGCANLANLQLARGARRSREMAVRSALGASRWRLARGVIVESSVLAVIGALAAALVAAWSLDLMRASFPEDLPYWVRFDLDVRMVVFVAFLCAVVVLLIGLVPALRSSRPDLVVGLKDGGRGASAGPAGRRLQRGLTVGQVALSLALLVGAAAMIRSFLSLQRADLGFDDRQVLTMRVYLSGDEYDEPEARAAFFATLADRLREIPGATAAAATTSVPGDDGGSPVRMVTDRHPVVMQDEIGASTIGITAGLFEALGLSVMEGRAFTAREIGDPASDVVVVNERLARQMWPDESAVGRRLGLVEEGRVDWRRVVGVAPDVYYEEVGEATAQSRLNIYVPYGRVGYRTMALLVRTGSRPDALEQAVTRTIKAASATLPIYEMRTMAEVRSYTTWEQRFFGQTMGGFALAALFLACLGVYGVVAGSVAERTREIGVRMVLGARPADVLRLVARDTGRLALIGVGVGLVFALLLGRVLRGVVFGVDPGDPRLLAATILILLVATAAASYLPSRRAMRIEPVNALRDE